MLAERTVTGDDLHAIGARVSAAVDRLFGSYLTNPGDGRDTLFAAMRHAGIGGGKRRDDTGGGGH